MLHPISAGMLRILEGVLPVELSQKSFKLLPQESGHAGCSPSSYSSDSSRAALVSVKIMA